MRIYIGSDHRGFNFRQKLSDYLHKSGFEVIDVGAHELDKDDDFTLYAQSAITQLLADDRTDSRAILVCGSGQGMAMMANRYRGIRAGLGYSVEAAIAIRQDEDSNVLAISADMFNDDFESAKLIIDKWIDTPYANLAKYNRRIHQLDEV